MISLLASAKSLARRSARRLGGLFGLARLPTIGERSATSVTEYWTSHTVHVGDHTIRSAAASLEYFEWRCNQYPGYLDLMPVAGFDGLDVLDFGCGPAHDLVGFGLHSRTRSLTGVDVSSTALELARRRLDLHDFGPLVKLKTIEPSTALPFPDCSFDYIHSSGVLHHVADLAGTLAELRRILRAEGRIRIMVYNRDSLWFHLYVPYVLQIRTKQIPRNIPIEDAFRASTDGPACPISTAWTRDSFAAEAENVGLRCSLIGTSISRLELDVWRKFGIRAQNDNRLSTEHRDFLARQAVSTPPSETPMVNGNPAGINLVLELTSAHS